MVQNVHVVPFQFGNQEDALHIMQSHQDAYAKCIRTVQAKQ
jgi:hypothetical protein